MLLHSACSKYTFVWNISMKVKRANVNKADAKLRHVGMPQPTEIIMLLHGITFDQGIFDDGLLVCRDYVVAQQFHKNYIILLDHSIFVYTHM